MGTLYRLRPSIGNTGALSCVWSRCLQLARNTLEAAPLMRHLGVVPNMEYLGEREATLRSVKPYVVWYPVPFRSQSAQRRKTVAAWTKGVK